MTKTAKMEKIQNKVQRVQIYWGTMGHGSIEEVGGITGLVDSIQSKRLI